MTREHCVGMQLTRFLRNFGLSGAIDDKYIRLGSSVLLTVIESLIEVYFVKFSVVVLEIGALTRNELTLLFNPRF